MSKTHLFYGNDLNSILERVKEITKSISDLNNGHVNIEKIKLDKAEDIEFFINQGSNLSLFLQNSLLEIYLNVKKVKFDEKLISNFVNFIKDVSIHKTVVFVLYLEKYEKTTQKALLESTLFKALKNIAIVEEHLRLRFWQKEQIKNKVIKLANNYNLKFENDSLDLFVDCFKEDVDNISKELEKIQVYILPENKINEKIINNLYLSACNVDDLYNALITKQSDTVVSLLAELNKLKTPLYLIASLQNKLRQALEIKIYLEGGKTTQQISKSIELHPYRLEKEIKQLQNITSGELEKIIFNLSDIEFNIKSGIVRDEKALEILLINFFPPRTFVSK